MISSVRAAPSPQHGRGACRAGRGSAASAPRSSWGTDPAAGAAAAQSRPASVRPAIGCSATLEASNALSRSTAASPKIGWLQQRASICDQFWWAGMWSGADMVCEVLPSLYSKFGAAISTTKVRAPRPPPLLQASSQAQQHSGTHNSGTAPATR
jgi:hypothetical protein